MNTRLALTVLVALTTVTMGCRDNPAAVHFAGICGIDDANAEQCSTSGKCDKFLATRPWVATQVLTSSGAFPNQLDLFMEIDNELPDNGDEKARRANTNDFTIEEWTYKFSGAAAPDTTYKQTTFIESGSSRTPVVPVIPANALAALAASIPAGGSAVVSVEMTAKGHLLDGSGYEAGPWTIAVDVFNAAAGAPTCDKAGDVVIAMCPHGGQTAAFKCAAP